MKDAEKGKFDVVLTKSLSRWARDTVDSITLVRRLKSYGICLMTVDDNYNSFQDDALRIAGSPRVAGCMPAVGDAG
ncbi:recombinase family protein [Paenibacillus sp. UNC499MF]|uniref:recombinase family protein n=1 Tax=Paenibacillus sp. UNC499MF TaxID=1502751 RepID=UPI001C67C136